jgi:hypothetical protein
MQFWVPHLLKVKSFVVFTGHETDHISHPYYPAQRSVKASQFPSALSRTLHILAQHPDAQEKLRRGKRSAQQSPVDISYDQLNSMEYLDAICRETLRLYVRSTVEVLLADATLP